MWKLVAFETRAADGKVHRPWGDNPVGTITWTPSGRMAAQLGDPTSGGRYVAYYGTIDVADETEGDLVHHVEGASSVELWRDQHRHFRFVSEDVLELQPPPRDGARSVLRWQRVELLS